MTGKKFYFLILLLLCSVISTQAKETELQFIKKGLIETLIENKICCISLITEDKIFIYPENIVSTEEGNFIKINGSEIYPLPILHKNYEGIYLKVNFKYKTQLTKASKPASKGPCPNCDVNTDGKGVCVNPLCWFKGIKVL